MSRAPLLPDLPAGHQRLRFGAFELDLKAGELRTQSGAPIKLQPQPLKILGILASRAGELVSREDIQELVWGKDVFVDFEHGLNFSIKQIRTALGDDPETPRYIQTIPRKGYRFIAPVEPGGEAQPNVLAMPKRADEKPAPVPAPPYQFGMRWLAAAVAVIILAATYWTLRPSAPPAAWAGTSSRIKLAVLPFKDLSPQPGKDYLVDGLTDEMIGQLGRLQPERVSVISRTSSSAYKDKPKSMPDIGRELGADYIVEGTVNRDASRSRVHVNTRLVRSMDDTTVWSDSYDLDEKSLFPFQTDAAWKMGRALALQLLPIQQEKLARQETSVRAAYDAYLQGRHLLRQGAYGDVNQAIADFEEALRQDPKFALAYQGLATAYQQTNLPIAERRQKAREAAEKAVALKDEMAGAHFILGTEALYRNFEWEKAKHHYERALAADPGYSMAYDFYAGYYAMQGRHQEALRLVERGRELDPFSLNINSDMGWFYYLSKQYPESEKWFKHTIGLNPKEPMNHWFLAAVQQRSGKMEDARKTMVGLMKNSGASTAEVKMVLAGDAATGIHTFYLWHLEWLQKQKRVEKEFMALDYASLGESAKAMDWLERGYTEHDCWILPMLQVDPVLEGLKGEARYQVLLKKLAIPSAS